MEYRYDFTETECKIMFYLYKINNKKAPTISEFCREVNIAIGDIRRVKVFNYLIEKGLIRLDKDIISKRIVVLDRKRLLKLLIWQDKVYFWVKNLYDNIHISYPDRPEIDKNVI